MIGTAQHLRHLVEALDAARDHIEHLDKGLSF